MPCATRSIPTPRGALIDGRSAGRTPHPCWRSRTSSSRSAARPATCPPCAASRFRCAQARCSGSSASRVRASRSPRSPSWVCCRRTRAATGSVRFRGRQLIGLDDRELSDIRGRRISMIFQDPLSALTPVYTVGDQIAEAVLVHNDVSRQAAHARAVELLALAGIPNAPRRASAFPHEFSGGMRQRVMIAMAMANQPDVIIADEPTTALDVTIQAQILDVLRTAKETTGAAVILITHDLGRGRRVRRPRRCDVRRPHRRNRRRGRCVLPAADAVHAGTARLDSAARRRTSAAAHANRGEPAVAGAPSIRLPLLAALSAANREVSRGRAGTVADPRARCVAPCRMPPQRRDRAAATGGHGHLRGARAGASRGGSRRARDPPDRARSERSHQALPAAQGQPVSASSRNGARRRRHQLRHPRARDAGPGRRVGLRQDDGDHGDPEPGEAAGRNHRRPRPRHDHADGARSVRDPPRPAGGLPGSAGVARSATADRRHPGGAAPDARRAAPPIAPAASASC